ncbi:hypothetical protein E2C01_081670 [Portunus trituberculatus]|uniref:Uncharacterized protein n=1 Tax=Portunus trituberculatus TaxID=210409 RepID=A0A5B7J2X6_PORTR|nr:hypothetical protein [Portunus trituberculatus]
MAGFKVSVL